MRNFIRAAAVAVFIALSAFGGSTALATNDTSAVVCKYVGTPGVDETLQTGQNPIVVSSNALSGKGFDGTFPFTFSDAQGQSIAIRYATSAQDGDISECPGFVPEPSEEPSPSTEPTATPTPSVSPTPTPTPSNSPLPSETTSPTPSPEPSSQPSGQPTTVPSVGPSANVTPPPTDTASSASSPTGDNWGVLFALGVIGALTGILLARTPPEARRANGRRDW